MIDIVFPKDNEKEFIKTAKVLGYTDIIFCYELKKFKDIKKIEDKDLNIHYGILANFKDIAAAKSLSNFVIMNANIEDKRRIFEESKPDLIFSLEDELRSDFIYQRNSGLNQVLCKLAKKNEIEIGLSFSLILNSKKRHIILGRMMQNIRFGNKYDLDLVLASFAKDPFEMRNPKDLTSLGLILKITTKKANLCTKIALNKIKENAEIKKSKVKGIKLLD